jgi:hypothetical protein
VAAVGITEFAAIVFAIAAGIVVAFQIALALGAPWGAYAMRGATPGRLPSTLRVAVLVQAVLIALLAVVVLSTAGLAVPGLAEAAPWLIWVAVAIAIVALVLNAISRSPGERRIWTPVAALLLLSSLVVALTAG